MNTKKATKVSQALSVFILAALISTNVFASSFTDISKDHPYYESISFLESWNVIEGYEDGTYKPDTLINRVEFLKIVLGSTNVKLDNSTPTGFLDIDESAWYGPYLRKATSEGWVQGYQDGTFKPEQNINKVEALKILGEIQKWDRLTIPEVPESAYKDTYRFSWYSPYVHFAKEEDLLFEETDYLYPDQQINRGYMAELVYRTMTKNVINYEPNKTVEDKIIEEVEVSTPSTFKMISKSHFDDLTLESDVPNVMYKNEIYLLKGSFDSGISVDDTFAFLSENNGGVTNYTHFFGTVHNGDFTIPLMFRKAGTFNLGIVPGLAGESKIAQITVLDGIPQAGTEANSDTPTSIKTSFGNDTATLSWNGTENNIFRIYFIQDQIYHSYIVRGQKTLDMMYKDFKFFNEGDVKVRIYGANTSKLYPAEITSKWAQSTNSIFNAVKHHFKLSYDDSITYSTLPETLPYVQKIYVSGTTYEPIYSHGAMITPTGSIDTFDITTDADFIDYYGNDVIQTGSTFSFVYEPSQNGTYILEINNIGGSALVNVPIYIGSAIPLIPDFFDLQDPLETTDYLNLEESRKELLNYINIERQNHGLGPVKIVSALNTLAQDHTDDMFENNFFAHINLEGKTPEDRRIDMSIHTDVGENLALAPTVYFAHEALMRSAIHRKNILTSYWDTVGLGLTIDSDGYLIIAEEFSHDPWTQNDLQEFEYYLLDNANALRTSPLQVDANLQEVARDWSGDMINQNFFSFVSPTGENLIDMVQNNGVTNEGRAYILKEGSIESLFERLIEESDVTQEQYSKIGFGLTQDLWSTLYLTVIFTQ